MTSISRATLADALWTGIAIRKYAFPDVCTDVIHRRGFIFPAMPGDPFQHLLGMLNIMTQLSQVDGEMPHLFDDCLFSRWGVNRIPAVPMKDSLPPETLAALDRCPSRLVDFYPQGLMKVKVGSNKGLCHVMLTVMEMYGQDRVEPPSKYLTMTVDINIFDRIIKVQALLTIRSILVTQNIPKLVL